VVRIKLHLCITVDKEVADYLEQRKVTNKSGFFNEISKKYIFGESMLKLRMADVKKEIEGIGAELNFLRINDERRFKVNLAEFNKMACQTTLIDSRISDIDRKRDNLKKAKSCYSKIEASAKKKNIEKKTKEYADMIVEYCKKNNIHNDIKELIIQTYVEDC